MRQQYTGFQRPIFRKDTLRYGGKGNSWSCKGSIQKSLGSTSAFKKSLHFLAIRQLLQLALRVDFKLFKYRYLTCIVLVRCT